jgi:23S rRNA (uracil1939-C5)-methyltransferase
MTMDGETETLHTIELDGMAHGGEAVGRLPDGRAVFVAGGIPGESVRVVLVEERKRWARARLVGVERPSPDRVDPPCPHFAPCGGCQWQHIALPRQRELKRQVVEGQLRHLGRIEDPPVEACRNVGAPDGTGYRNHAVFRFTDEGLPAYHREGSRERVPIDHCMILHPLLQEMHEALPALPGMLRLELRAGTRTGQRLALAEGSVEEEPVQEAAARGVPLRGAGQDEFTEMVGPEKYRISSKSFFQVNTEGAEALVDLVLEMLAPGAEDQILDAYAGVGLFTVPLARRGAKVFAVERHRAALRDLRHQIRGLPVHVVGVDFARAHEQLPARVDLAVADPPREGLTAAAAEVLVRLAPRRLALVSCDPASLARDAARLGAAGYRLERVVPVDLFPHTFHVETVSLLAAG